MKSYNDLTDKEKKIIDMINKKINDAVMNDLRGFILEQAKLGTAMMKYWENYIIEENNNILKPQPFRL